MKTNRLSAPLYNLCSLHHHAAVLLTPTSTPLVAEASIMMSPRPILKRSESTHEQSPQATPRYPRASVLHKTPPSHGVHFPPSPNSLAQTFSAYSPSLYDRSPIVVSPNSCALPERGCPGRTYTLDD